MAALGRAARIVAAHKLQQFNLFIAGQNIIRPLVLKPRVRQILQ